MDGWIFEKTGSYIFGSAAVKSTKDIHLEGGLLLNKDVIVEGVVEKVGEHGTFFVLFDPNGRLLIDLTSYYQIPINQQFVANQKLRVLGRVKSGRKGLLYLSALSIKPKGQGKMSVATN